MIDMTRCADPCYAISENTHNIAQRFYFIQRLLKLGEAISRQSSQKIVLKTKDIDPELFSHNQIKEIMTTLKKTKSIKPLSDLWLNSFITYKYINDPLFNREFTAALLHTLRYQKNNIAIKNFLTPITPLQEIIDTDTIVIYFYALKRLSKPFEKLESITIPTDSTFLNCFDSIDRFFKTKITTHIEKIRSTKKLTPLFDLWIDIKQYRYAHDINYIKELSALILIVYKKILLCKSIEPNKQTSIDKEESMLLEPYEQIDSCSLEQIFESIDEQLEKLENEPIVLSSEGSLTSYWYQRLGEWAPLARAKEIFMHYLKHMIHL